jgi:competence transcription factor ComK
MSWINKISVEDYKQARFDAAVLRLNRLSMEVTMSQDQYNWLYKEILKEFDNITK